MKKFLLSALVLSVAAVASAEEYTVVMSDCVPSQSAEQWVSQGFTFTTAKNAGTTAPAYNSNNADVRLYAKNTLNVKAEGANITSLKFEISAQGLRRFTEVTPSDGVIIEQGANPLIWNGWASDVTLTVGDKAIYGTDGEEKAGQFDFLSVTILTDGPVGEVTPPAVPAAGVYEKASKIEEGEYVVYAESSVAKPLSLENKTYGYWNVVPANVADNGSLVVSKDYQFTIKAAEGGYNIMDPNGKFYCMQGTYNSFNLIDSPDESAIWTITADADGTWVIKNVSTDKTIQYDSNYSSFGVYPDVRGIYPALYVYTKDDEGGSQPVDPEVTKVKHLSDVLKMANNEEFVMDADLTVVYSNGAYTYVYDGSSYGLVYKYDLGLNASDVLANGWKAHVSIYNNLVEIVPDQDLTVASTGAAVPEPLEVEGADAEMYLTAANQGAYLKLMDVNFAEATAESGSYVGTMGDITVNFYNRFKDPSYTPGNYDVTCFVAVFKDTVQVYPVKFDNASGIAAVESDNAAVRYFNIQGMEVANPQAGQLYIEQQGSKVRKVIL